MVRQGVNVIADAGIAQREVPKPKKLFKKIAFFENTVKNVQAAEPLFGS